MFTLTLGAPFGSLQGANLHRTEIRSSHWAPAGCAQKSAAQHINIYTAQTHRFDVDEAAPEK